MYKILIFLIMLNLWPIPIIKTENFKSDKKKNLDKFENIIENNQDNREDTEDNQTDTNDNREDTKDNQTDTNDNREDNKDNQTDTNDNLEDTEDNQTDTNDNLEDTKDNNDTELQGHYTNDNETIYSQELDTNTNNIQKHLQIRNRLKLMNSYRIKPCMNGVRCLDLNDLPRESTNVTIPHAEKVDFIHSSGYCSVEYLSIDGPTNVHVSVGRYCVNLTKLQFEGSGWNCVEVGWIWLMYKHKNLPNDPSRSYPQCSVETKICEICICDNDNKVVNCRNKNLDDEDLKELNLIHSTQRLYLDENKLTDVDLVLQKCERMERLVLLSLNHNRITNIPYIKIGYFKHLDFLELKYNNITKLNVNAMRSYSPSNIQISVEGNPFICDCSTIQFLEYLQEEHEIILHDLKLITCHDKNNPDVKTKPWMIDLTYCQVSKSFLPDDFVPLDFMIILLSICILTVWFLIIDLQRGIKEVTFGLSEDKRRTPVVHKIVLFIKEFVKFPKCDNINNSAKIIINESSVIQSDFGDTDVCLRADGDSDSLEGKSMQLRSLRHAKVYQLRKQEYNSRSSLRSRNCASHSSHTLK